jgi:hypothetical protein
MFAHLPQLHQLERSPTFIAWLPLALPGPTSASGSPRLVKAGLVSMVRRQLARLDDG